MTETLTVHPQILNYYNYNVICNYRFEEPEPVIQNTYTYEENGVYYCTSATQKGVYWYIYARNCPLMYTDPSGDFFWLFPSINWSKEGGISFGLNFIVGIPGVFSAQTSIGFNPQSGDLSATIGVTAAFNTFYISVGTQSGLNLGWSVGLSPQIGLPISSNFTSIGVNYNVTNGVFSGNISAFSWQQDRGWSFNPSFSVAVAPEQFTNLARGQGFRSNSEVYDRMMSGDALRRGNPFSCQDILDYFGFKGTYDPNKAGGSADDKTGKIFYGDYPFQGNYDRLALIASHELRHSRNISSGKYKGVDLSDRSNSMILNREEWDTYMYNYKNLGLYPSQENEIIGRINSYGLQVGIYGPGNAPDFAPQWWHFIYRIPRLW